MRAFVVVTALLLPVAARADLVAPAPPASATTPTTPASSPSSASAASAITGAPTARAPKLNATLCGCASSRFLARGNVVVDGDSTLSAWLHAGAQIGAFTRDAASALTPTTLPTTMVREPANAAEGDGGDALVHVAGAGVGKGFLGVTKAREHMPRDVVGVDVAAAADGVVDDARAPVLDALWLAAPEQRERPVCGAWSTMRTTFSAREGSVAAEGFIVRDIDTNVTRLVDARHVGAFGLGEVPACHHGFPVSTSPQTLEVVPVSARGVRGAPWVLRHDGRGLVDVIRVSSPPDADADLIASPFPEPGQVQHSYSWASVGGVWTLSALFGLLCGVVGYLLWRFKRRRLKDVRCASCNAAIPVDVLDEKTDGFFCPACGKAGVWKGRRRVDVDVTQL